MHGVLVADVGVAKGIDRYGGVCSNVSFRVNRFYRPCCA